MNDCGKYTTDIIIISVPLSFLIKLFITINVNDVLFVFSTDLLMWRMSRKAGKFLSFMSI